MVTSGAFRPQLDIADILQGQGGNGPPPHFGDMLTITCRTFIISISVAPSQGKPRALIRSGRILS